MPFLLLLSCASPVPNAVPDSASTTEALDPLSLADQVSAENLANTIQTLQSFGSRNIRSATHNDARDELEARLTALGLPVEEERFDVNGIGCTNLIARLDGAAPDQVWIFSAHYDSTSTDRVQNAPGADDNASSVATVLEAARLLSAHPLQQSIWFVLTDAEEEGSLGSAHLVAELAASNIQVQGVIAPDMIGYWPLADGDAFDILGDTYSLPLAQDMAAVADSLGVPYKLWTDHFYCYGDDHSNYQEADMPAVAPMDCVEAHNLPASGEQTPHYHQTTDTLDTVYLPFTRRVAGVLVATLAISAGAS